MSDSLTMTGCMENDIDPDQLASPVYIWFLTIFKEFINAQYQQVSAKLGSLCIICGLGQMTSKILIGQVHYGHLLVPGHA